MNGLSNFIWMISWGSFSFQPSSINLEDHDSRSHSNNLRRDHADKRGSYHVIIQILERSRQLKTHREKVRSET